LIEVVIDLKKNLPGNKSFVYTLAGVMFPSYEETADSLESQFQINYLGHLFLTQSLMEILKKSGTDEFYSRIINVSSIVHCIGSLNLQNFDGR
jgi:NAD(P)-dependent dehydrogenase (short-subunit alcohol dehydrogenase family)